MPFAAFLSYSVRCLYVFLSGFVVFETPLPPPPEVVHVFHIDGKLIQV